jgi:streptogramin lyase/mono/diheme cytochrome c family protein
MERNLRMPNIQWKKAGIVATVLLTFTVGMRKVRAADQPTGSISGRVTADKGAVIAFRVKAKDVSRKIAYTVFTQKGSYQIFNLPPGNYQVAGLQGGYESTIQKIELKAGESKTADIALTAVEMKHVKLVDYNELFPPGHGRDVLMQECGGCHGLEHIPWQALGPRNEDAWRDSVNKMFSVVPSRSQVPVVSSAAVTDEKREAIVQYFASIFGEDSERRDLKLDPVSYDESALSKAIYMQYELPPLGPGEHGARKMHDVFPSRVSSHVYMVDLGVGSILGLDLNNPDYSTRWKVWHLNGTTYPNVIPHGITESKGHIYWTELNNSAIGELDPETNQIHEYQMRQKGSPHTPRWDSKGNIWFTSVYNDSRIGRLDAKTKTITTFDPAPAYKNAHYYGVIVDQKDRVWAAGSTAHIIVGYDPKTGKWTTYPTPTQPSGARRLTVDSRGKIWFSEHIGNGIGMLDPETGKIVEYKSPIRMGGEYECWADPNDKIWVSLRSYAIMEKFDPETKKFTFFPYPELRSDRPQIYKMEIDAKGTMWFSNGTIAVPTLTSFREDGNVPSRGSGAKNELK